jgi:hypothetical protein
MRDRRSCTAAPLRPPILDAEVDAALRSSTVDELDGLLVALVAVLVADSHRPVQAH